MLPRPFRSQKKSLLAILASERPQSPNLGDISPLQGLKGVAALPDSAWVGGSSNRRALRRHGFPTQVPDPFELLGWLEGTRPLEQKTRFEPPQALCH